MIKIADLKIAVLESERLDRLGRHKEAVEALEPVIRVASRQAMMREAAPWWTYLLNGAGKVSRGLMSKVPGVGKYFDEYGERALAGAAAGRYGRNMALRTNALSKGLLSKIKPGEAVGLTQFMKDPANMALATNFINAQAADVAASTPATRTALANAQTAFMNAINGSADIPGSLKLRLTLPATNAAAINIAELGGISKAIPARMRPLAGPTASPAVKDLYEAYHNADRVKFGKALDALTGPGGITDNEARILRIQFLKNLRLTGTPIDVAKAAVGGTAAVATPLGGIVGAVTPTPQSKPTLFPTAPAPGGGNPSMYPSREPSSTGTAPRTRW